MVFKGGHLLSERERECPPIHGSMLVLLHPAGWANHRERQAREESVSHSYNLPESVPPGVFSK